MGGNAVDAAVATAFALGVVRPDSSGIGGGGFMVYYRARDGHKVALDFRETAPAAARSDMFQKDGRPVESLAEEGGLAVAVPSQVAGLEMADRMHGRLPWGRLLSGAISLARDGVAITQPVHEFLAREQEVFDRHPQIPAAYYGAARRPPVGTLVANPGLAATLLAIAQNGADALRAGPIAADIVRSCRRAGGVLTCADLAGYRPVVREPLVGRYRGLEIVTMGPPSSGGVVILETLNMLASLQGWPPADPGLYHHLLVHVNS
jgi:gamma-glutamyltranspeptidase/glutathione hydrolase